MSDDEHLTELYHIRSTDQWDVECICGWRGGPYNSADTAHDYAVDHHVDCATAALTAERDALRARLGVARQAAAEVKAAATGLEQPEQGPAAEYVWRVTDLLTVLAEPTEPKKAL